MICSSQQNLSKISDVSMMFRHLLRTYSVSPCQSGGLGCAPKDRQETGCSSCNIHELQPVHVQSCPIVSSTTCPSAVHL